MRIEQERICEETLNAFRKNESVSEIKILLKEIKDCQKDLSELDSQILDAGIDLLNENRLEEEYTEIKKHFTN